MIMNKDLTLVFSSYQSQHLLKKILSQFHNNYKIIIIENSQDLNVKLSLEKKFNNVEVIVPDENLGLAKSYNLGIKKAKISRLLSSVFIDIPERNILQ